MNLHHTYTIQGGDFSKAGIASSSVKKMLKQLSVDTKCIKRTVIALYEGEVNIVAHAWRGEIDVTIGSSCIEITLSDEGPGIADIEQAMVEGFSTASKEVREMGFGAGMGLANMRKNSDKLDITSEVDKGTIVKIVNYF